MQSVLQLLCTVNLLAQNHNILPQLLERGYCGICSWECNSVNRAFPKTGQSYYSKDMWTHSCKAQQVHYPPASKRRDWRSDSWVGAEPFEASPLTTLPVSISSKMVPCSSWKQTHGLQQGCKSQSQKYSRSIAL